MYAFYYLIIHLRGDEMAGKESAAELPAVAKKRTRVIFSHGDKGGVGKSMIASAIADYLQSEGEHVAIIEADTQNPDVARMFENVLPCANIALDNDTGWMEAMDFVARHQGHTIVISTPGSFGRNSHDHIPHFSRFIESLEIPAEMELWWTINRFMDSVILLENAHAKYGKYFKRVRVVRNLVLAGQDGRPEDFIFWNESTLKPQIEKAGGLSINFPALHIRVTGKLFRPANYMPFSDAILAGTSALGNKSQSSDQEPDAFSASEHFRLKDWFEAVGVCLKPALFPVTGK